MRKIRAKAVVVIKKKDQLLLLEEEDKVSGKKYYLPPGAFLSFGEISQQAARRIVQEVFNQEIEHLELLGVSENVFQHENEEQHEILFSYLAEFTDPTAYEKVFETVEGDGEKRVFRWMSPEEIEKSGLSLHPEGLLEVLKGFLSE